MLRLLLIILYNTKFYYIFQIIIIVIFLHVTTGLAIRITQRRKNVYFLRCVCVCEFDLNKFQIIH